ncbi:Protoporphyrinogen oxidase [Prevotella sp. khp1]|nr:Protoporphyrinogen oxidase [Prevotella sp. khp1]
MKIAIIGAGISGMSAAHFLKENHDITIFEKDSKPGGLIKCRRINGSLFHTCGGHVFNSKRQDVLDWFWSRFNKEVEFTKTDRNSCVFMDKNDTSLEHDNIPYPIENHMYLFDKDVQKAFYEDLDEIDRVKGLNAKFTDYDNFGDFLRWRFGKTLYNLYFQPYNEKVWRRDLTTVPMSWMEGKLPMPTTKEMRDNNANKVEEKSFVHSTFWYEKKNGSQFIADKLAEGLNIKYGVEINSIQYMDGKWNVCGEVFDKVIFCGNIKDMVKMIKGVDVEVFKAPVDALEYHGTTAVFCEIDKNPYSWIYQPSRNHESHRIICTGNFSQTNNDGSIPDGRITATIEFTDEISKENILDNLKRIPLHPEYIDHVYNQYTYPIQDANTRGMIKELKSVLSPCGFYFTGRFADWEYYNMDVAIGAAMDLVECIIAKKDN